MKTAGYNATHTVLLYIAKKVIEIQLNITQICAKEAMHSPHL